MHHHNPLSFLTQPQCCGSLLQYRRDPVPVTFQSLSLFPMFYTEYFSVTKATRSLIFAWSRFFTATVSRTGLITFSFSARIRANRCSSSLSCPASELFSKYSFEKFIMTEVFFLLSQPLCVFWLYLYGIGTYEVGKIFKNFKGKGKIREKEIQKKYVNQPPK